MSLLIIGCGYVGRAVAEAWLAAGETVAALTRGGADRIAMLAQAGIEPINADWLDEDSNWSLPAARHVLVSVPHRPDDRFGERTHCVGLGNLIHRVPGMERLVVLSTTGVYHQTDGERVDELSETRPTRIGPQIALAAEQWLQSNLPSRQSTALRLAGIYGPGRVPLISKLRAREAIPVSEGALNLIHIDDITQTILKLLRHPAPRDLYVLSDGQAVERRLFYEEAARIFKTPPPEFTEPDMGSARAGRGESHKRIDPQRIVGDLALELKYPNHIAGLKAIAAQP